MLGTVQGHSSGQNSQKSAFMEPRYLASRVFLCPTCLCGNFPARHPGKERGLLTVQIGTEHFPDGPLCWMPGLWNESLPSKSSRSPGESPICTETFAAQCVGGTHRLPWEQKWWGVLGVSFCVAIELMILEDHDGNSESVSVHQHEGRILPVDSIAKA